jgi:hypothetical protein
VSGDKNQAILEPIARMEIDPATFPGNATIKDQKYAGWMLFDVQKGFPTKGQMGMYVAMDVKAGGETGTVEMTMKMKMKSGVN